MREWPEKQPNGSRVIFSKNALQILDYGPDPTIQLVVIRWTGFNSTSDKQRRNRITGVQVQLE
jgi:hypothetical protein